MVQGVSIVAGMFDRHWHKPFTAYYDPDPDGVFAGKSSSEFLDLYGKKHEVYINANRAHGILVDAKEFAGRVILNVDSGVSWERLKELVDNGVTVISLDHHEIEGKPDLENNCFKYLTEQEKSLVEQGLLYYCNEETGAEGVILNNQYEFEDPDYRFMSGCGVSLDVFNQLNPNYQTDEHVAWHGITLLSDSREIENELAYNILVTTYETKIEETTLISHLTDAIGFNTYEIGEPTLDRAYIDFYLTPFINAMFRLNMGYEAIRWFNGETLLYTDVKEQQKLILEELKSRTTMIELENVLLVNVYKLESDYFEASNFIGLLANRLLANGKTVVITCSCNNQFERGSVRGYYNTIDYQAIFKDYGFIALGHKGAFGLKNFSLDKEVWDSLDKRVGVENESSESTYVIHTIRNLGKDKELLKDLAYMNQFLRPMYKHYIRYTGLKFFTVDFRDPYQEYKVDGLQVKCFNKEVNVRNGFILPSMSKGFVSLYLERIVV
ncbi:DHH family phosphoesterase [Bacillus cereus]|uniref:DHH family phosphoesterase n=1 Tax=Bacillus cereus TaxID=1396 RepID=UPI003D182F1A